MKPQDDGRPWTSADLKYHGSITQTKTGPLLDLCLDSKLVLIRTNLKLLRG